MSAKSLKFFGPPTTKWRPFKISAKLNGNHLLMANTFKLHQHWIFDLIGYLKNAYYDQNLICQQQIQFVKKFSLRLTGCRKCYFLVFAFFIFPNFKWLVSKWISRVLMKFYYITNIFDLQIFDNETTVLLIFFFFFLKFAWKCILFLYYFYMKEILQPPFWWYI